MKKILLSSIVLFAFSLSMIVFQMSCKKEIKAQTNTADGLKQIGKILYKGVNNKEVYLANYDGSGKQKINFTFPAPTHINDAIDGASMSPDGKTIFLTLYSGSANNEKIYSCSADGSGFKLVLSNSEFSQGTGFFGAY